jgi:plasmid stabilization system protein ParE
MSVIQWMDAARDQLADIYVTTPSEERNDLVQIILSTERDLSDRAATMGESRGGNHRVLFVPRVTIFYTLDPHGVVRIFRIRPSKRRWSDEE